MKLLPFIHETGKKAHSGLGNIFGSKAPPEDTEFRKKLEDHRRRPAQRLLDVWNAKVVPLAPEFIAPVYLKSKEESKFIEDALSDVFLFEKLKTHQRNDLVLAFQKHAVSEGTEIIKKDHAVGYFYIIQSGTVTGGGEEYGPSDLLGELALLYDYPSEATYTAKVDCVLWRLDQVTFQKAVAAYKYRSDMETRTLLKSVTLFKDLDDAFLAKVAYALRTETYKKGDTVIKKGDECKSFYIIKEGSVKGTDIVIGQSHYKDMTLKAGEGFGEGAIMKDAPSPASVTAVEDTTLLCLPKEVFMKLFGDDLSALVTRSLDKKKLKAIPVATKENHPNLEDYEVDLLTTMIKDTTVPKGHVFFKEGRQAPQALYLIRSGSVSVRSSAYGAGVESLVGMFGYRTVGDEATISEGGYFGADTLKTPDEGKPEPAMYTIAAEEECKVGILTMEDIWSIVSRAKPEEAIPFTELEMYRILGAGTFGKVWLVSQKGTKEAYALKVQSKRKMIEYNQVEGVIREKNMMARLNHPFVIKLVSTYKDETSLFMLTKLYQGGEFRSLLSTGLPEPIAAFYAANILQGLSFMHDRRVIHRDLKPENVLLDSQGYCVLIDLGFAKVVTDKTYTFCGTPIYIASEVIAQTGYDKGADLWSWGVMVYEMIVGITPFYDREMSQMTLFKRIVNGKYAFPSGEDFMSGESKNLIRQMLVTDPTERLGSFAGGHQDIRDHQWFRDKVDFDAIEERKASVPWVPKVKDPLDDSNFDNWDHLEKEEEKEDPLSAKEQHYFDSF